jgi:chromosomal replication initiation ATPase DnaA
MHQLELGFSHDLSYNIDDYIVTKANEYAYQYVTNQIKWQSIYPNILAIIGNTGSGKTHLAHIWQQNNNASFIDLSNISDHIRFFTIDYFIIDGLEKIIDAENQIFHFLNYIINSNKKLLITSNCPLDKLGVKLQDLSSRLNSIYNIAIDDPDDILVNILLQKQFANMQLHVDAEVSKYISSQIPRSYEKIKHIAIELDKFSLLKKRNITIPLFKEFMSQMQYIVA